MSAAVRPARCSACSAAFTDISQRIDHSSLLRSGMLGTMRSISRMLILFVEKRLLMPEALSMNSLLDSGPASISPASMSCAFYALKRSAEALKLATTSLMLMLFGAEYKRVPLITALFTAKHLH